MNLRLAQHRCTENAVNPPPDVHLIDLQLELQIGDIVMALQLAASGRSQHDDDDDDDDDV